MRKPLVLAFMVGVLTVLPVVPVAAGDAPARSLTIEKILVGPAPSGSFGIVVDCQGDSVDFLDGVLLFGGESTTMALPATESITCTLEELLPEDLPVPGAPPGPVHVDTTFACQALDAAANCDSTDVVSYQGALGGEARVTVTNTYQPAPTTTTAPTSTTVLTTTTAPTAAVAVVPTFTG